MKILLYFPLFVTTLLAEPLFHVASEQISLLYSENGSFRAKADETRSSLAATNMAMRAFRYLEVERQNTSAQKAFLTSCFNKKEAAFIEVGSDLPTILANAHALMLMGELGHPEDVLAISARDYLVEHAESADEIYMAMAGMVTMGLTHEVPASWLKTMMDIAVSEEPETSDYQKARAIITCMRAGFNLPDYSLFLPAMEEGLKTATQNPHFYQNPESLQHAYTFARAVLMIDGRTDFILPDLNKLDSPNPTVAQLYKLAALQAWQSRLQGQLKVAICTGFAPVGYRDEAGRIAGIDADLMRAFAEEEGYELLFVEQTRFDGIWELPTRGHFDAAVSGLSKRADRLRPGIRWSYPYFNVERSLSILKSNADRFRDIADFDDMKIAVTTGTTGDQDILQRNPDAIRVPYESEEAAIKDLLAGKVHALARGDVSNRYDARLHPELTVIDCHPMEPVEEFVIAVAAERVALGQKLDRFLRNKRRTGELDKLFEKYLEQPTIAPFPKASHLSPGE